MNIFIPNWSLGSDEIAELKIPCGFGFIVFRIGNGLSYKL